MNYRSLGRTGLVVSEIGFGAWGIGGRTVSQTSYGDTDDRTSLAALARAHDCGITFFDTSAAYGNGHSEELIGEALAGVRHKAVLATKAGYEAWDRPPDFSAAAIVASTERSLGRLRTDYLDLLLLHNAPLDVLLASDVREALTMARRLEPFDLAMRHVVFVGGRRERRRGAIAIRQRRCVGDKRLGTTRRLWSNGFLTDAICFEIYDFNVKTFAVFRRRDKQLVYSTREYSCWATHVETQFTPDACAVGKGRV